MAQRNRPGQNLLETRHVYTLHGEIAWGGMATVRLARQTGPHGLSRIVAVKNLLARSAPDSEFVSMFRDEIRVASRVNHPNVVPVVDVVATDDELLLVMEYVHGESVARLLKRCRGPIPPKIATTIMAGVLRGLHAAHLARSVGGEPLQVIHRDVTPHNMVVGVDGTPRLLDFGIAHAVGRLHATRVGHVKGKLAYMAPEQFLNTTVDQRVDIYSAAVTLWEMLAGRRLFDGHKDKMLQMILHQTTPPPGSVQRGVSPQLDAIVLRGLQRDPRQRYATARDMAIALEQETELVSATELGDWVSRTWGEARTRREQQISAIEGDVLPPAEAGLPSSSDASASEASTRRLPSSESVTWALDGEEPGSGETPPADVPTRPELPSALFPTPPAPPPPLRISQTPRPVPPLRISQTPRAAPTLRLSQTPRPAPTQAGTGLARHVPLLIAGSACLLLGAHLWLGVGGAARMEPAPLAVPATVPAHPPNVEPLRASPPAVPDPAGAPVPESSLPPLLAAPVSRREEGTALAAQSPAVGASGAAPAGAPHAERCPAPPAVRPAQSPPPSTAGRPRQQQQEEGLRQRAPARRAPGRGTVVAAARVPRRAASPASTSDAGRGVRGAPVEIPDRPQADCDPPFFVDGNGIKHFKLACL